MSKFSYFCICDTPLNCYYITHQSYPSAHLEVHRSMGTCSISLLLYCTIPVNHVITWHVVWHTM